MARRARRATLGRDQLAALRKGLGAGWPCGLTVLTGDDLYHLDTAQRELLESLAPVDTAASEFALTVFGEERVDVTTVVAAARSVGMFSPRRVVLVREVGALDGEPDALVAFAEQAPEGCYLLVRAPALDQRRKLHKALLKAAHVLSFGLPSDPLSESSLQQLSEIAAERGLELGRDAASLLAQACATDLYRASSELDKIVAWLGGSKARVTPEIVRELASGGSLMTGWEVANAVLVRDRSRALGHVRRLVDHGDAPLRIVGGLAWRARQLLQASAMRSAGRRFKEIVDATRAWGLADDLERGLDRYTLQELLRFPSLLLEADRRMKSRSIEPQAVLEDLIDAMTGETTTGHTA